jgi:hypothetical protein
MLEINKVQGDFKLKKFIRLKLIKYRVILNYKKAYVRHY